jgi:hypothetical protein
MYHVLGEEMHARFCCGNLRDRYHLKDLGVDGKIMFNCFFQKTDGDMDWIICRRMGASGASCEFDVPSGSIRCAEFLD